MKVTTVLKALVFLYAIWILILGALSINSAVISPNPDRSGYIMNSVFYILSGIALLYYVGRDLM